MILKEILNDVIRILERVHIPGADSGQFSKALDALREIVKILEANRNEEVKPDDSDDQQGKGI